MVLSYHNSAWCRWRVWSLHPPQPCFLGCVMHGCVMRCAPFDVMTGLRYEAKKRYKKRSSN